MRTSRPRPAAADSRTSKRRRESSPHPETDRAHTPSTVSSNADRSPSPRPPDAELVEENLHHQSSSMSTPTSNAVSAEVLPVAAQPPYSYFAYVPDDVILRMESKIRTINAPDRGHFAINNVPAAATWGFGYNDRYLTYNHKNLVVWAVGRWRSGRFVDNEGNHLRRVNAGIYLPHNADREAFTALTHRSIPTPDITANFLWAKRYMTVREGSKEVIKPFGDAYDARHSSDLASAPSIQPWKITQNDIVLIRFRVTRWRPGGINQPWKDGFKVLFELLQVYLLYEASPRVPNDLDDLIANEAADVNFDI
ncbi:hypothetical protein LXA43DRAFT_1088709 [Ganoderma leucocontextum]|nr:hypothetical protein LXA43DRAFT_1088709 [Ganoderma leucocontextum]